MKIKPFISKVLILAIILTTVTSCSYVKKFTDKKPFTVEFNKDNPLAKDYDSEVANGVYINRTIRKLPNMITGGTLNPLWVAMALDKTGELQDLVLRFSTEKDIKKRNELAEKILLKWTGCDDLIIKGEDYKVDPRKIIAVGRYLDDEDKMRESLYMTDSKQISIFNDLYKAVLNDVYCNFIVRTHYKDFYSNLKEIKKDKSENEEWLYLDIILLIDKELKAQADSEIDVLSDLNRIIMYEYDVDTKGHHKVLAYLFSKYPEYVNDFFKYHNAINEYTDKDDVIKGLFKVLKGGDGNDTIYGNDSDKIVYPGKGNDKIYGLDGDDIYIINKGDGVNTIYETLKSKEKNFILFGGGITEKDIVIEKINDNDIVLNINGSSDSVVIKNQALDSLTYPLISKIYFSDGEVYNVNLKDNMIELEKGSTLQNLLTDQVGKEDDIGSKLTEKEKSEKFSEILGENGDKLIYKNLIMNRNTEAKVDYVDYDSVFLKDGESQPTDERHSDITSDQAIKWNVEGRKIYGISEKFKNIDKKITLNGKELNLPISFSDFDDKYSDFDEVDINKITSDMYPFTIESKTYGTKLFGTKMIEDKPYQFIWLGDKENKNIGSFQIDNETSKIEGILFPEHGCLSKLDVRVNGIGVGNTANEMYDTLGTPHYVVNDINVIFYYIEDSASKYQITFMFEKEAYDYRKKGNSKVKKNTITGVAITKVY